MTKEKLLKKDFYHLGGIVYINGAVDFWVEVRKDGRCFAMFPDKTEKEIKDDKHLKELMK